MSEQAQIKTGPVHHAALTVTDVRRSTEFYTGVLGFQVAAEFGPRVPLSNGSVVVALAPAPDSGDRFDENRVGLDHLSFSVASRAELDQAVRVLDEHGLTHGEVTEIGSLGIAILAFRDPDNIQLELTAPSNQGESAG